MCVNTCSGTLHMKGHCTQKIKYLITREKGSLHYILSIPQVWFLPHCSTENAISRSQRHSHSKQSSLFSCPSPQWDTSFWHHFLSSVSHRPLPGSLSPSRYRYYLLGFFADFSSAQGFGICGWLRQCSPDTWHPQSGCSCKVKSNTQILTPALLWGHVLS